MTYCDRESIHTHRDVGILFDVVIRMRLDDLLDCRLGVWLLSERHGDDVDDEAGRLVYTLELSPQLDVDKACFQPGGSLTSPGALSAELANRQRPSLRYVPGSFTPQPDPPRAISVRKEPEEGLGRTVSAQVPYPRTVTHLGLWWHSSCGRKITSSISVQQTRLSCPTWPQ